MDKKLKAKLDMAMAMGGATRLPIRSKTLISFRTSEFEFRGNIELEAYGFVRPYSWATRLHLPKWITPFMELESPIVIDETSLTWKPYYGQCYHGFHPDALTTSVPVLRHLT